MERTFPSCSVVVPVYNGEATLEDLVRELWRVLSALVPHYEVILVNDGSRDRTWPIVERLCGQHPWLTGINLMRNYGQHNALLCGIRAARHEVIVTIDDDFQQPPDEIPRLLACLGEGFDVVYGTPRERQDDRWRNLGAALTKLALQSAMGMETARQASAFRAFRSEVRKGFATYQGPFVSIDVLLTWGAARFASVPVRHEPRRAGRSSYTLRKLVAHAVDMTTGFSMLPLRFASWVGFGFTLFGVAVLAYVIGRYFIEGGSVPGFPFLASIIAIFSGAQLFALGIIGEYLARMHFRIMERPAYIVRNILEGAKQPAAAAGDELQASGGGAPGKAG